MINCQDVDRNNGKVENTNLTVRLLVSCSGSGTSKLLGLIPSGISDQQGTVELDEDVLDLLLALLVNKLLVVGDQGLGEGLSDGVDLGDVATALHTDADIDISKPDMGTFLLTLHNKICPRMIYTCPFQEEELAP